MYARAICVRTNEYVGRICGLCLLVPITCSDTDTQDASTHASTYTYEYVCMYIPYVDPCDKMPAAMYAEGSNTFLLFVTVASRIAEIVFFFFELAEIVSNVTSYVQMDQIDRNRVAPTQIDQNQHLLCSK
jgi:hypothetical protein